ncbi:hypothetical protein LQW54_005338 [Pestalotiopsis sp. IQ-011]
MHRRGLVLLRSLLAAAQTSFHSDGNPILSDGSVYSADPAPLVVNDTLYILAGRDEAAVGENNFIMNEWQMFVSSDPNPAGGDWQLYSDIARPASVFAWAAEGAAYAAQIIQGADGKFYMYAPVTQAGSTNSDTFAIGVAVADSPLGPFVDAHPDGPIISQSVPSPGNTIQNIDPTVFIDDDGRVYLYEGTFGQLRGFELADDMVTINSSAMTVTSLTARGHVLMLYAANNAGADSPCTPTSYHACIAYGTAASPLGPWTFRGIVLGIVSSTTSHPGVFSLNDTYYFVYLTADAVDGGHFRRSVAFDEMTFDDSQSPPAIEKVVQTQRPTRDAAPTRNVALSAAASSVDETPIQYWIASVNDGKVPVSPLPPDYWCSYDGTASPATSQLVLTWNETVTLNGTRMVATTAYFTDVTDDPSEVSFEQLDTAALRATLVASGSGSQYGGVGVKEWEALAPTAQ